MKVSPGIYFGRLDFVCVVLGSDRDLGWLKTAPGDKFVHEGFEFDIPNRKVTRLSNKEERRITEADEFGISFEPFKL